MEWPSRQALKGTTKRLSCLGVGQPHLFQDPARGGALPVQLIPTSKRNRMEQEKLVELTDEALLEQAKIMKPTKIYDAVIFGFLIGITIYSAVKNGFGWLTFLPLVYLPAAGKNKAKREALEKLLKERNLE